MSVRNAALTHARSIVAPPRTTAMADHRIGRPTQRTEVANPTTVSTTERVNQKMPVTRLVSR
jgi:hypothetical protein